MIQLSEFSFAAYPVQINHDFRSLPDAASSPNPSRGLRRKPLGRRISQFIRWACGKRRWHRPLATFYWSTRSIKNFQENLAAVSEAQMSTACVVCQKPIVDTQWFCRVPQRNGALDSKPRGFYCAPQVVPTDISHFQKSALPRFRNRSDTKPFNQMQQNMNTNCDQLDLHKKITTHNHSCAHTCAHACLTAVEPQPAPRAAILKEEKSANNDADTREKNLERAIVTGAVLILVLVVVVYYLRFVAPAEPMMAPPNLGIEMITHY